MGEFFGQGAVVLDGAPDVDVGQIATLGHLPQHGVESGDTLVFALEIILPVLDERKQALDVDLRAGALPGDDVQHAFVLFEQFFVGGLREDQVVGPRHDEHGLGLARKDGLQAGDHARYAVAADAAVEHVGRLEIFAPQAAFREAVAQHDDVVLLDGREFVEGTAPRVVGLVDAQRVGFCCGGVRHGRGDYDG